MKSSDLSGSLLRKELKFGTVSTRSKKPLLPTAMGFLIYKKREPSRPWCRCLMQPAETTTAAASKEMGRRPRSIAELVAIFVAHTLLGEYWPCRYQKSN